MYSPRYGRCREADLTGAVYLSNMNKIYFLKHVLCLICLENLRVGITELLEKNIFSKKVILVNESILVHESILKK